MGGVERWAAAIVALVMGCGPPAGIVDETAEETSTSAASEASNGSDIGRCEALGGLVCNGVCIDPADNSYPLHGAA